MTAAEQIAVFAATNAGLFDGMDATAIQKAQEQVLKIFHAQFGKLEKAVLERRKLTEAELSRMTQAFAAVLSSEG